MNVIPTLVVFTLSLVSETLCYRLCGKQLADMLDLVCDGRGFNVMYPSNHLSSFTKRSASELHMPTLTKRAALQYLSVSPSRERGGIVAECCRNACTVQVLESYCAAPSATYFENPTSGPVSEDVAEELTNYSTAAPPAARPAAPIITTPRPRPIVTNSRRNVLNRVISQLKSSITGRRHRNPAFFFVRPVLVGDAPTRSPVVS